MASPWNGSRVRAARAEWAPHVATGAVLCHLCGRPIRPGQQWDIDHLIPIQRAPERMDDPSNQRPAHSSCNRSRGAALGNRSPKRRQPNSATRSVASSPESQSNPQTFAQWVASWRNPDPEPGEDTR